MAKKTKTGSAPPLRVSTAATTHGKDAFGAQFTKNGFSFTAENDLAFAFGWPHLFELAEGHPDDADPAASALRICNAMASGSVWGLETAPKLARGWAVEGATDMHGKPLPAFLDATSKPGPVSADEAHDLVSRTIRTRAVHNLRPLLLVCEALVGPDATVNGALEGLAATPPEVVWGHSTNRAHRAGLVALGLMLLRLRPADREAALSKWQGLFDAWKAEAGKMTPILDASHAVLRPHERICAEGPVFHVEDKQGVVAWRNGFKGKPTDDDFPDPRFVFLGGEEVYRAERAVWSKYSYDARVVHPVILERFGRVKSPLTVELVLELANKSKVKSQAAAWLSENAAYAKPELERLASSGPLADWAKAALSSL